MSISSALAVSMMIGTVLIARSRRQVSRPSTRGIITSSTTRSNSALGESLEGLGAVDRPDDLVAVLTQGVGEQREDRLLVVDQQNPRGAVGHGLDERSQIRAGSPPVGGGRP